MGLNKSDFIEIAFTGRFSDNDEVFDTNIKEDAKAAGLDIKEVKPFILAIGHQMLPSGFDKDLEGKEEGKEYTLKLSPEDAFGKRQAKLVRMIPTKHFHEQKIDPVRGMQLSLDGQLVKILSNSSGRTLVDFNNPLAGKPVTYKYKIVRKVTEPKEKVDALQDFLFRRKFDHEINEGNLTFKIEKEFEPFVKLFSEKISELTGLKVLFEYVTKGAGKEEKEETSKKEKE